MRHEHTRSDTIPDIYFIEFIISPREGIEPPMSFDLRLTAGPDTIPDTLELTLWRITVTIRF